jgi:hypothetical protein
MIISIRQRKSIQGICKLVMKALDTSFTNAQFDNDHVNNRMLIIGGFNY